MVVACTWFTPWLATWWAKDRTNLAQNLVGNLMACTSTANEHKHNMPRFIFQTVKFIVVKSPNVRGNRMALDVKHDRMGIVTLGRGARSFAL
jgi:hypothetical protein